MRDAYQVVYTPQAYEDIISIYNYIAFELKSKQNAAGQVNRIRDAIRKLDTLPERHEVVDWEPWMSMGMHKLPVDNYIVFYLVDSQDQIVTVNRIFYGGRNIEEIVSK